MAQFAMIGLGSFGATVALELTKLHHDVIGIDTLKTFLKLKIEDYSKNNELRELIRDYNDLICEHIIRLGGKAFVHSRVYF